MEYEKSIFQDLESFLRTMRTEKDDINFLLQKCTSNFETGELPLRKMKFVVLITLEITYRKFVFPLIISQ